MDFVVGVRCVPRVKRRRPGRRSGWDLVRVYGEGDATEKEKEEGTRISIRATVSILILFNPVELSECIRSYHIM